MNPDPYDDSSFAAGAATEGGPDRPDPRIAERPVRKPSRPYGLYDPPPKPKPAPSSAPAGATEDRRPARLNPPPASHPADKPLSPRREAFCQAFVVRGNATRAAMEAGYSVIAAKNQGYRLLRRAEVQARIAAIHRAMGAGANRDADVLLGKLEAVYRRAVDGGYLNAAARIVELQARMAGRLAHGNAPPPKNDDFAPPNDDR